MCAFITQNHTNGDLYFFREKRRSLFVIDSLKFEFSYSPILLSCEENREIIILSNNDAYKK